MRQIILDTETTGLRVEDGHRIIEIGCLEMNNRQLTGKRFHVYLNPEREVDAGAVAVHGITNEFLRDKPLFQQILDEFMDFISGSELVIHNAPFDVSFINNELQRIKPPRNPVTAYCGVIDTLQMARRLHVGQRNSLDALCKRYQIDHSKRELHGALLDAHLLAQVYLAMTGGQGSFFDASFSDQVSVAKTSSVSLSESLSQYQTKLLKADANELVEHDHYLILLKKQGKCIWND